MNSKKTMATILCVILVFGLLNAVYGVASVVRHSMFMELAEGRSEESNEAYVGFSKAIDVYCRTVNGLAPLAVLVFCGMLITGKCGTAVFAASSFGLIVLGDAVQCLVGGNTYLGLPFTYALVALCSGTSIRLIITALIYYAVQNKKWVMTVVGAVSLSAVVALPAGIALCYQDKMLGDFAGVLIAVGVLAVTLTTATAFLRKKAVVVKDEKVAE